MSRPMVRMPAAKDVERLAQPPMGADAYSSR
jgi:hypothetical protein